MGLSTISLLYLSTKFVVECVIHPVLMTPDDIAALLFTVVFPENASMFANGSICVCTLFVFMFVVVFPPIFPKLLSNGLIIGLLLMWILVSLLPHALISVIFLPVPTNALVPKSPLKAVLATEFDSLLFILL